MKKLLWSLFLLPILALAGTSNAPGSGGGGGLTVPAYLGTACNNTLYPASLLCVSNAPTTDVENHNIGIVGGGLATYAASGTPLTGWGVGVYGKGWTNGATRSNGVTGEGMVTATGDTGAAVGVRGYSLQTHAGGLNIGVYGTATGGATNYDFYSLNGTITSATGTLTNTGDLATTGKLTVGSGGAGLQLGQNSATGRASLSSPLNTPLTTTNYMLETAGVNVFLNSAGGSVFLQVAGGTVLNANSTGVAVTGTLSSTGVLSLPAGTSSATAIQFGGSATTGFYSTGAGGLATTSALKITSGYTVAALNTAYPAASNVGRVAYVTDALAPAWGMTVAGGGAVVTPVFCDGTNWTVR